MKLIKSFLACIYRAKLIIQNNKKNFQILNNFDDVSIFQKKVFFCLNRALTLIANKVLSDHFVKKWKKENRKQNLMQLLKYITG